MALPPNWWDEYMDEKLAFCGNATDEEKAQGVLDAIADSGMLKGQIEKIIKEHDHNIPGPTLSQALRQGIGEFINDNILT